MGLPILRLPSSEPLERGALRRELESIVERALALLDALDGDPDLEPSFGSVAPGFLDECEPSDDDEPSLGWSVTGATTQFDMSVGFVDLEEGESIEEVRW